jgi:hypothetical protein
MRFGRKITEIASLLHEHGFTRRSSNKVVTEYYRSHDLDEHVGISVKIDDWDRIRITAMYNGVQRKFALCVAVASIDIGDDMPKVLSCLIQGIEAAQARATEYVREQVTKEVMSC